MIYNIKNLRLAKIYKRDLEIVMKELARTYYALSKYGHYKGVGRLLVQLKEEMEIMTNQLRKINTVVDTKGEIITIDSSKE